MDEYLMQRRLSLPVTSVPGAASGNPVSQAQAKSPAVPFQKVLDETLAAGREVSVSRHAAERAQQRGIELTRSSLERIGEGVRIARSKGLDDTLILLDQTMFIVSAKNATVITAMSRTDLCGNAITNIEGAVVV